MPSPRSLSRRPLDEPAGTVTLLSPPGVGTGTAAPPRQPDPLAVRDPPRDGHRVAARPVRPVERDLLAAPAVGLLDGERQLRLLVRTGDGPCPPPSAATEHATEQVLDVDSAVAAAEPASDRKSVV